MRNSLLTPPNKFISLHSHDGFSTFDGLGYPQEHIDFVIENGMDGWCLTNHGHMNSLECMFELIFIIGSCIFCDRTSVPSVNCSVFKSNFFCLKLHMAVRNRNFSS